MLDMTLQESCDYAVKKIVEQGKRCMNQGDVCLYSDGNGNHCAVGWLLTDEEAERVGELEETAIRLIRSAEYRISVPYSESRPVVDDVLTFMQDFHDETSKEARKFKKARLSTFIDVSAPQYDQWVNLGT